MDPITLRLSTDTIAEIDKEADEEDLSRAEYLRNVVKNRHVDEEILNDYEEKLADYEREVDRLRNEYEEEIADLEREIDRLQNEKRLILEQREEHQELVEFAEEQRELTRYQERRQRLLDDANILRRWKWKVTGVPVDDTDE